MNQPNYRLIAVKVGNVLKWDATVNEVGRAASALFRFSKEEFPNESITSQRAKLVHDWILTLAKQRMEADERNKLLVKFCQHIAPAKVRPEVDQILMRSKELRSLRYNVKHFFAEFKSADFASLSEAKVQEFLDTHRLSVDALLTEYAVKTRR